MIVLSVIVLSVAVCDNPLIVMSEDSPLDESVSPSSVLVVSSGLPEDPEFSSEDLNHLVLDLLHKITKENRVWVRTVSDATFVALTAEMATHDDDTLRVWVSAHACCKP